MRGVHIPGVGVKKLLIVVKSFHALQRLGSLLNLSKSRLHLFQKESLKKFQKFWIQHEHLL